MSPTLHKAILLVLLTNIGCGGGGSTVPFTDNSQDADKYALSVKQAVSDQVAGALSSSEPADQISAIVTLLENPDHRPAGPHEAIYLEILAAAKDITLDFSTVEGRPEGIEESLAKLTGLADKLPGTVKETVVEGGQGGGAAEQD